MSGLHRRTHTSALCAPVKKAVDGGIAHDAERCASARSDVFVTQRQICVTYVCRSSTGFIDDRTSDVAVV